METLLLWVLVVVFVGVFARKVATRVRLIRRAPGRLAVAGAGHAAGRLVREVVFQSKVIAERPFAGVAHALVFWGFVAFAGYTSAQFLAGLGLVDVTGSAAFRFYSLALVPFALGVLAGISFLLVRRAVFRPEALGKLSGESILIGLFIAALMVTFLLDFRLAGESLAGRLNWWTHALVILVFLALIPDSKHFHLLLSPVTIAFESPVLGDVRNLDFDKEELGYETVAHLERKQVLDAFTCVECGRCQMNCPAYGTGKLLNPKKLILDNENALLAGKLDAPLASIYDQNVLWQCTTCGACEAQCPVGIEHLPLIVNARRGLASNGEAPDALGAMFNNLERRGNIWGLPQDQRQKFVASAGLEAFDPSRHEYLMWLGCAGSYDADFQKSLRSLFALLHRFGVSFGVLEKERCTGDPAKRTGNEYMYQELAHANIEEFQASGVKKILTACPHCLKTLGEDYRLFGFEAEVVHSTVLLDRLVTSALPPGGSVVLHDACYLARYAGHVEEPRSLLRRAGAGLREPERNRHNPFCCGAGGGLLFEEHEEGRRISQARFEQLQATGAATIVTECPFCSIMLKGAQASSNATTEVVDIASYVEGRLKGAGT